jgi:ribosome-interacting GTPase 1
MIWSAIVTVSFPRAQPPASRTWAMPSSMVSSEKPVAPEVTSRRPLPVSLDFLDKLAREPHTVVMSCELDLGIQDVVERCWKELQLIRIYTKRKGVDPDFSEALIVRSNSTVEDVCDSIHRTLKDTFKYALVWGASARHIPQRVGLGHPVADEDVIHIVSAWRA